MPEAKLDRSIYIASSLLNKGRVCELRDKLQARGIGLTYDWTAHGFVSDPDSLAQIAMHEAEGVVAAKCVLMVLPARLGTHFEMGLAWALKKPVVMLMEDAANHTWTSFHKLPEIIKVHTEIGALDLVEDIVKHNRNYPHADHAMHTLSRRYQC